MLENVKDPATPARRLTIGEEFVKWAEEGWAIEEKYNTLSTSESGEWEVVKPYFIQKIDEIVQNRIKG